MAYGKGKAKDFDRRTADVARVPTTDALADLRRAYLDAVPPFVEAAWPASVLGPMPGGKAMDRAMLDVQAGLKGTLNSVWAEKARLVAKAAVTEQHGRARRNLLGRVMHLSAVGDTPVRADDGRIVRRLFNFPEAHSLSLTDGDVVALQARVDGLAPAAAFDLLRAARDGTSGLPPVQADALAAMVAMVEARFGRPQWDTVDGVVQLHLDWRCVAGTRVAWPGILKSLGLAVDAALAGAPAPPVPFAIAARRARGEPLPLVARVRPGILCRLAKPVAGRSAVTSVAVEIGPRETAVRLVLSAAPAEPVPLEDVVRLVGRDFGLANTCAYAVVEVGRGALTRARLDLADAILSTKDKNRAKAMARAYLEDHGSDAPALETLRLPGRNFLDRVAAHADRIDGLRSEIDLVYARVGRVKRRVNAMLDAPADAMVDLDAWHADPPLEVLVLRMGRQLDLVGRLKALRRKLYETIDGLKRSCGASCTKPSTG